MAEWMHDEGMVHLCNAIVISAQPQLVQIVQQYLPSNQLELLGRAFPAAQQRIEFRI